MKYLLPLLCLLVLTGCWDQRLLKNARLIYAASYDNAAQGKIHSSLIVRTIPASTGTGGQPPENDYAEAIGYTPRQTRQIMDSKLSGNLDASKNRVVLISTSLAKKGIYPLLDVFYRDPQSSLGASLALVDGSADQILKMKKVGTVLIAEYISHLIQSGQSNTYLPRDNLQELCPPLFDDGQDIAIPLLKELPKQKDVIIKGVGLMNNRQYSGIDLNRKEASMLLLLRGVKGDLARITEKVGHKSKATLNYITIDVVKNKPHMNITFDAKGQPIIDMKLDLEVEAIEFPHDHLTSPTEIKKLNATLTAAFTKLAQRVIYKLQKANCDGLGIGRQLMAYHRSHYEKLGPWRKGVYQKIKIKTHVTTNVQDHGIIN
ncbi:spore germination protein GerKC [Fictibacillus macauensis ZFHKF-1]|uniref:Spore germination protein GerKC n=1 Tax=Fictibacillus macauensis ZFHKF-1 TaxID=1196324 RepID=I8AGM3_9BACL|nr:Ger(x)C family spore germination protein [Fictibacillus macauensis]EIT84539.1 spore germination protein GerKC [Fictibacillus macauensis ZFHKF-1]